MRDTPKLPDQLTGSRLFWLRGSPEICETRTQDTLKQLQESFPGGNAQGAPERLEKIRKDAQEKAEAVLTDEQKKTLKEMKGGPFELKRPGR